MLNTGMNHLFSLLRPCCLIGLVFGLVTGAAGVRTASAQNSGPTKDASIATARTLTVQPALTDRMVQLRSESFVRRFAADFGVTSGGVEFSGDAGFLYRVHRTLEARWGDTNVYEWIERGLVFYARMKAYGEMERKGFDFEMDMDDVADGKLGLKVARSLE